MIEKESKFKSILNVLGPRITDGVLRAEDVITLAHIESEFACSRTVAREVQRALEAYGFVTAQRRVGLVVQAPSRWNVFDPDVIHWRLSGSGRDRQLETLTDLRLAIEPHAVASAARYASRQQREEILNLGLRVVELGAIDSGPEFMEADVEFHRKILEYSDNEMFAALAPVVESVLTWRTQLGLMPPHPEPRAMHDHSEVAYAIYLGQPERGFAAMRDLVDEVNEAFRSHAPNVLRSTQGENEEKTVAQAAR
ncbi:MAG: GntR family transcriptional regulator [Actinobacteria bacterium]|nr:MAG: GntR family transcriptional regulator [Actinomycetota bacterium]